LAKALSLGIDRRSLSYPAFPDLVIIAVLEIPVVVS
jgi:hypothetical protein